MLAHSPTSSIQVNVTSPTTAGQRPSRSGYGRRAGARRPTSAPVARPIARHGLKARKTSPNRIDATTRPTQNVIITKVDVKLLSPSPGLT